MFAETSEPARLKLETTPGGAVCVWLDRPGKRNAIDDRMVAELLEVFSGTPTGPVVLGTTDARCFCAGADLDVPNEQRAAVSDDLYGLYERMLSFAAPIVVALEGPAVGGGAQLAIAGDLRVAAPSATLRFVGPAHGLAVGSWGLPGLVGRGRAFDLCLTMRPVGADDALAYGLVDRVDPDPKQAAIAIAEAMAELDPAAVARAKSVVHTASATAGALREERSGNFAAWSGSVAGLRRGG